MTRNKDSLSIQRLVPGEVIGEYTRYQEKSHKHLYPLKEEGEYGPTPVYKSPGKWKPPPQYEKREKKPKMYASYAVDHDCAFHGHKIGKYERTGGEEGVAPRLPSREPSIPRYTRALSAPIEKAPLRTVTVRQTSLPPIYVNQDGLEMLNRIRISRSISKDLENALLDRSTDMVEEVSTENYVEEEIRKPGKQYSFGADAAGRFRSREDSQTSLVV